MSTACNISIADGATTYKEESTPPLFWLGVLITLVGSTITPLGMNLQRLAQLKLAKRSVSGNVCLDPLWLCGLLIFICGNACDAVALAMAPQSVVTPLGCVSLVSNLFIARLVLKERLTSRVVLGSFVVMLGVVAIVFPASQTEECLQLRESLDTLLARWRKPGFIVYASCQFALLCAVGATVRTLERRMHARAETSSSAGGRPVTRFLSSRELSALRVGYPLFIGLVATWTVLFVKCAGELLTAAAEDPSIMREPATYVLVSGLVLSVPTQLVCLNRALAYFEALWVIPGLQCFWSLSSITTGAIFFDEFHSFAPWMFGSFLAGVALSLAGIALVATSDLGSEHPDSDSRGAALLPREELLDPHQGPLGAQDHEEAAVVVAS